ncbi:MAG: DUF349 domain-containing protein [Burkholderiales bacterium]|nr:DUF349 domain-containing protein [Burkholderiales bacterium]
MISRFFSRSALHEHAEPAQRALGVSQLEPGCDEINSFLLDDPAPEVRLAAVRGCTDAGVLVAALAAESDAAVREAISSALALAIVDTADAERAAVLLAEAHVGDAIRAEVVRRAADALRRRLALDAIGAEAALVELALGAVQAETRLAAAERVVSQAGLQRLAEAAKHKDHGVYRIARQRLEAMKTQTEQAAEADRIMSELEALAQRPGAILTEVVELNRRWQALDMSADAARLARCDAARRRVQERLEREQDEQRARVRFDTQVREWVERLQAIAELPDSAALAQMRSELAELREQSRQLERAVPDRLHEADERLGAWERESAAVAAAEVLVLEAERLASGTYIDHGDLPQRWEALSRSIRTPAFTRRFEAAMIAVEQRRLAHIQLAQQELSNLRGRVHALLHTAEQALAAGQLREARSAADEIKKLRTGAGTLPKPSMQRIGRLQQQLVELERWQAFGQHNARVQLCERAEALAAPDGSDPRQLARAVQDLRNEWKVLDQQYAGVPKALWERFDRACEKAYAPAARHFAEQAARRKEARKKREAFITLAAEHAAGLLQEPRDWRAIERWLRETDQQWREGDLGSLEPKAWKDLDTKLKAGLAPLRSALGEAREQAKQARKQLIAQAVSLAGKALERDTPAQVKAIQAQWQEQAKAMSLAQRDERALWDEFRAACDAVFKTRQEKRKADDGRKSEARHALERIVTELDQLAAAKDKPDQDLRRSLRALQDQWREKATGSDPAVRALEARFRAARASVEAALGARARLRDNALWQVLASKEKLCERLDVLVRDASAPADAGVQIEAINEQWSTLPALASAWEKKIGARREAALQALADVTAQAAYRTRMQDAFERRREAVLELEVLLGLDSPPELQAERLALQVRQLRDRFKNAASVGPEQAGERLCDWCAQPGVADAADRARVERVFAAAGRRR